MQSHAMPLLELVASTFSPRLPDGRYIFRPWGKWGPCYPLTPAQRTMRARIQSVFYLATFIVLMFFTEIIMTTEGAIGFAIAYMASGYLLYALFTIGLSRTDAPPPLTAAQREAARVHAQQAGRPVLRRLQIMGGLGMLISAITLVISVATRERELFEYGFPGVLLFGAFTALMTWQLKLLRKRG